MLGHRELTIEEYLEIAWRRIWVIVIPAVLVCAGSFGYSLTIQDQYTSQTLVLVEQQKVPDRFVPPVITDELNQRLGTMREQILSRSRLQPLIDRYPLFSEEQKAQVPLEDLINRLRQAIKVTPVQTLPGAGGGQGLPGFYISFTWSDAHLAQQICQQITSMFMEENLKWRESRAQQTTAFLQKQLDEAKAKLDAEDARLAEFKRRYIGQLPGQEQTNLNLLMGLNTQLEAVTQMINRAQQEKSFAETQLQQQLAAWQSTQLGTNPRTLQDELELRKKQLIDLQARYTENHPDVTHMKQTIADLERRIAEAEANPPVETEGQSSRLIEPPQIQQLRSQIRQLDLTIREKTREQERLQEQIKVYQARVQLSPMVEQQYKELTRDYDTAQRFYNELLAKKAQSEMGQALERDQQGEQFRIMDPANLPERPSYPNRLQFALGGLLAGLVLGGGIAVLLEMRDKSIRNERDIQALLGLPTLALLPVVQEANGKPSRFWKKEVARVRPPSHAQQARV